MWILEEAGSETELTVVATLGSAGACNEHAFREALSGLEKLGYLRRESEKLVLTPEGYGALTQ